MMHHLPHMYIHDPSYAANVHTYMTYYTWLVYELSKTIFLGDPSFQCNLFASSPGTNEFFTNLLYDLTPYHIYKKIFLSITYKLNL